MAEEETQVAPQRLQDLAKEQPKVREAVERVMGPERAGSVEELTASDFRRALGLDPDQRDANTGFVSPSLLAMRKVVLAYAEDAARGDRQAGRVAAMLMQELWQIVQRIRWNCEKAPKRVAEQMSREKYGGLVLEDPRSVLNIINMRIGPMLKPRDGDKNNLEWVAGKQNSMGVTKQTVWTRDRGAVRRLDNEHMRTLGVVWYPRAGPRGNWVPPSRRDEEWYQNLKPAFKIEDITSPACKCSFALSPALSHNALDDGDLVPALFCNIMMLFIDVLGFLTMTMNASRNGKGYLEKHPKSIKALAKFAKDSGVDASGGLESKRALRAYFDKILAFSEDLRANGFTLLRDNVHKQTEDDPEPQAPVPGLHAVRPHRDVLGEAVTPAKRQKERLYATKLGPAGHAIFEHRWDTPEELDPEGVLREQQERGRPRDGFRLLQANGKPVPVRDGDGEMRPERAELQMGNVIWMPFCNNTSGVLSTQSTKPPQLCMRIIPARDLTVLCSEKIHGGRYDRVSDDYVIKIAGGLQYDDGGNLLGDGTAKTLTVDIHRVQKEMEDGEEAAALENGNGSAHADAAPAGLHEGEHQATAESGRAEAPEDASVEEEESGSEDDEYVAAAEPSVTRKRGRGPAVEEAPAKRGRASEQV